MAIYFARYDRGKSIRMLSLHYQKLLEKIEEHQKKYLVVDEYIINKVLDKIKGIINIKKSDDTKISVDTSQCCKRLWKCCDINYVRY